MNRILCFFFFSLSSILLHAKSDTLKPETTAMNRWSIALSAGYGLPFAKQVLGNDVTVYNQNNQSGEAIRGSLGQGWLGYVTTGFRINEHLGVEGGIFSVWGKNKITNMRTNQGTPVSESYSQINTNGALLGLYIGDTYSKIHLAFHTDFILGIANRAYNYDIQNGAYRNKWTYYGGLSFGCLGKISASYPLTDKLNLGIEPFFMLHSWSPAKGKNATRNIEFTDEISLSGIYLVTSDKVFRVTYPLHAAGVTVRFSYNF